MKRINKVAILGAGTMGARIAAHFANAGVPSYLLDIVPPRCRWRSAKQNCRWLALKRRKNRSLRHSWIPRSRASSPWAISRTT